MAGEEHTPSYFVSTVTVRHPRLGVVRLNTASYVAAKHGQLLSELTQPPVPVGVTDPPLKDPKVEEHGNTIAEQASPMHRA
jgi:hypothetical protein